MAEDQQHCCGKCIMAKPAGWAHLFQLLLRAAQVLGGDLQLPAGFCQVRLQQQSNTHEHQYKQAPRADDQTTC